MKPTSSGLLAAIALMLAGAATASCQTPGVSVHEWGTFTSLQDETGRAIGGINTDDEPVPRFVHDRAESLLYDATELPMTFSKGVPACRPDVTMRLETPVLYVHAPDTFHGPLDVRVSFKGGWLTQYYPHAEATLPGIDAGALTESTVGRLEWLGLGVNASGEGPQTTERVWLAPRAVQASMLRAQEGESERFLFYRGIGHLDAPLRVVRSTDGRTLDLLPGNTASGPLPVGKMWLADIRPDGTAAFRMLEAAAPGGSPAAPLASAPAQFPPGEYTAGAMDRLRADLRLSLIAGGLFPDEADALLNTWEVSYFKAAGLRLFFLVPQSWTDRILPLEVSGVSAVTRVMVGRIEIVTPHQRDLLTNIASGRATDADDLGRALDAWWRRPENANLWGDLYRGKLPLAKTGVAIPAAYRSYLDLGRFRDALVLDAQRHGGGAGLDSFIKMFRLPSYPSPSLASWFH